MILHVDMDAFFASVEQRDHPEWRGKPVIVGSGPHERGVVSTCSYEARKFGVHSAMPSRTAFQYCPHGIFVKPRMAAYEEASAQVFEILGHYSPFVEGVSIDEAFLDISGTIHLMGSARALGEKLRAEIWEKCRLTCSVGIATNRLLAKIGSEEAKPNGLFEMPTSPQDIATWLSPRPAKILWGVGKKTSELLQRYGFRTCGDIQQSDIRFLERHLGTAAAYSIREHAFGRDCSVLNAEAETEKSVSREHTFAHDESNRAVVRASLLKLVTEVGARFRRETRYAHTAKLKLRDGAFNTLTRQMHFEIPARDNTAFRQAALELFDREWIFGTARIIRLIGFGVTDISQDAGNPELSLFGPDPRFAKRQKNERLSDVLDKLNGRATQGL